MFIGPYLYQLAKHGPAAQVIPVFSPKYPAFFNSLFEFFHVLGGSFGCKDSVNIDAVWTYFRTISLAKGSWIN